jgi:hypothetical protein
VVKENILNKRETVQALMDAVQKGNFESAKTMLADDFQFSGPVPEPIDKEAWLGMSASLKAAFPDWDVEPTEGAGLMAILGQLGVEPASM